MGRQVVHALAEILESGAHDPRLTLLTFTAARMSDDLRSLRVFYTCMGDEASVAEAKKVLARAQGYLRSALAERLALRFVPSLSFEYDETMQRADRIEKLLRSAHEAPQGQEGQDGREGQEGQEGQDESEG